MGCDNIEMGEEIVASYCMSNEQFPTKDQRKKDLKKWGFTCTCQVLSISLAIHLMHITLCVHGLLSDRGGVEKE